MTVSVDLSSGQADTTVTLLPGQCLAGKTLSVVLTANSLGGASNTRFFAINSFAVIAARGRQRSQSA